MSSAQTLARPYARAAFELARDAKALADWSAKLELAASVARDARVQALVGNPRLDTDKLIGVFLPKGEATGSPFANFLATLAANRRLPLLVEIAEGFDELKRTAEGVLKVRVRAAVAIDGAQVESLKAALARRFKQQIELESVIDETVIGGAIIDAGDVVIDGSVRGRLERLAQTLTH